MVQLKAKDFSSNGTFGKLLGDMGVMGALFAEEGENDNIFRGGIHGIHFSQLIHSYFCS